MQLLTTQQDVLVNKVSTVFHQCVINNKKCQHVKGCHCIPLFFLFFSASACTNLTIKRTKCTRKLEVGLSTAKPLGRHTKDPLYNTSNQVIRKAHTCTRDRLRQKGGKAAIPAFQHRPQQTVQSNSFNWVRSLQAVCSTIVKL